MRSGQQAKANALARGPFPFFEKAKTNTFFTSTAHSTGAPRTESTLLSAFAFLLFGSLTPNPVFACIAVPAARRNVAVIKMNIFAFVCAQCDATYVFLPPLFIFRKIGNVDDCLPCACTLSIQLGTPTPRHIIVLHLLLKLRMPIKHFDVVLRCERERQFNSDPSE